MLFPFFSHITVFILLVFITGIKRAYTDDTTENYEKGKFNEYRKMLNRGLPNKPQQIPCHVFSVPLDRVKSALKDLEIMNELYCSANPNAPPVETIRAETPDESQTNPDQDYNTHYNQGHHTSMEQDPLGQRTINYPLHYGQQWMHYPSVYPYNYADRAAFQNPNYYYPSRSSYVQLYSGGSPATQQQSMIGANADHGIPQGTPIMAPDMSTSDDADADDLETLKKKARKYDRHCSKRKAARRLENPKLDESEYPGPANDTDLDIANSTEIKNI